MKTVLIALMMVLFTATGCAGFIRGPFSGKVVDAETKEPIEGAVVLVVWNKAIYGSPGGPLTYFEEAKETLTDKNGDFFIEKYNGVIINPLARIRDLDVRILIYKPGYCKFPGQLYSSKLPMNPLNRVSSITLIKLFTKDKKGINIEEELFVDKAALAELLNKDVIIVELLKLKSREERIKNLPGIDDPFDNHNEKKKNYIRLLGSEAIELGLQPEKE